MVEDYEKIKKRLYALEKKMDEEGLALHIKKIKTHLQGLIYIYNNQYSNDEKEKTESN